MPASEVVSIALRADLTELKNSIAQIPGITAKEAKGMVAALEKQLKAAEQASDKAAKASASHWDAGFGKIKAVGNKVTGGMVTEFEAAGEAAAAVGPEIAAIALAGAALAAPIALTGALGAGLLETVFQAQALEKSLKPLSQLPEFHVLPKDERNAIDDVNGELAALYHILDEVEVLVAGKVAPAFDQVGMLMVEAGLAGLDAFEKFKVGQDDVIAAVEKFGAILIEAAIHPLEQYAGLVADVEEALGQKQWADNIRAGIQATNDAIEDTVSLLGDQAVDEAINVFDSAAEGLEKYKGRAEKLVDVEIDLAEATKKTAAAAHDLIDAYHAELDAQAKLGDVATDARSDEEKGLQKINDDYQKRLVLIEAAWEASAQGTDDQIARDKALAAADARRKRDEIAYQKTLDEAAQKSAAEAARKAAEAHKTKMEYLDTERQAVDAVAELGVTLLDANIARLAKGTAAQKKAAREEFAVRQALATAEVAVDTAVAVAKALPNPFAVAAAIAGGAIAEARVLSVKPPSFAGGGMIWDAGPADHRVISMKTEGPPEAVLTGRGVANIGGPEGVNAANLGQNGGPLVIQHVYKHKVLDQVLVDNIARGGPLSGLKPRPGHSRRRR